MFLNARAPPLRAVVAIFLLIHTPITDVPIKAVGIVVVSIIMMVVFDEDGSSLSVLLPPSAPGLVESDDNTEAAVVPELMDKLVRDTVIVTPVVVETSLLVISVLEFDVVVGLLLLVVEVLLTVVLDVLVVVLVDVLTVVLLILVLDVSLMVVDVVVDIVTNVVELDVDGLVEVYVLTDVLYIVVVEDVGLV